MLALLHSPSLSIAPSDHPKTTVEATWVSTCETTDKTNPRHPMGLPYADQLGWCQGGQCRYIWQSHGVWNSDAKTLHVLRSKKENSWSLLGRRLIAQGALVSLIHSMFQMAQVLGDPAPGGGMGSVWGRVTCGTSFRSRLNECAESDEGCRPMDCRSSCM